MGVTIKGKRGGTRREKGGDPIDEARREAIEVEEMDEASGAEVVEEALNVKKDRGGDTVRGDAGVD
jgi:hypothetical protein